MTEEDLTPVIEETIQKYLKDNLKIEVKADHNTNKVEVKLKLKGKSICKDSTDIRYLKTR